MICDGCGKEMRSINAWLFDCVCGRKRTLCEVYSRVVGYIRPTTQWNDGKRAEFKDRVLFEVLSDGEQTRLGV